jgi:hypothetical protein
MQEPNISKLIFILFTRECQSSSYVNDDFRFFCEFTTKNIVIWCALSEAVLYEPHLKHYQQQFISSCPFHLLGAGLSKVVLHAELLVIILWIISISSCSEPMPICELSATVQKHDLSVVILCTINSSLLSEQLLIRIFYSGP